MRMLARVAITASSLALAAFAAAPANAAGNAKYVAHSRHELGSSCSYGGKTGFESYGEWLTVTDTCADGHSAVGVINIANSTYYYWNSKGADTTRRVNMEFAENAQVGIKSCLGDWSGTATDGILWETCGEITFGSA
ncbi:hypothetical protein [Streptomyces sp. NPDC059651]|uniref:hypothetical protein n=1 Tax=unclassified Streptomyces TaxID=2593676 RepID=UPI00368C80BA